MTVKDLIKLSIEKGYFCSKEGEVFNCKGEKLKLYTYKKAKPNYNVFNLRAGKKVFPVKVCWIQAYQKYSDKLFEKGMVVRHKNNISTDDSWDNILIGSQKENMLDIPKISRILGASNPKYLHAEIIKDRELGLTYKELMLKYNISSKGTVSFIINKSLKGMGVT